MNLDEVLSDIEAASTPEELRRILDDVCQNFGFSGFNFIDAGSIIRDDPFWIGTAGERWEDEYISNDFAPDDPVIRKAITQNLPFYWSDVKLLKRPGPRDKAAQTMDAAQDHGFKNGFVIPHHFRDDIGRSYTTCTCFFWKSRLNGFFKSLSVARHDLHLIMMYWTARASELSHENARGGTYPVGIISPREGNHLSDRERDVLLWTARGKTTEDIAEIIKISPATVNSYIKNAIMKLDATNRTHAVTKAIYLGMIQP